jgi:hypothetical protein
MNLELVKGTQDEAPTTVETSTAEIINTLELVVRSKTNVLEEIAQRLYEIITALTEIQCTGVPCPASLSIISRSLKGVHKMARVEVAKSTSQVVDEADIPF